MLWKGKNVENLIHKLNEQSHKGYCFLLKYTFLLKKGGEGGQG